MTEHRVHTSATADGWAAACPCGWHVTRRTRAQRDTDSNAHQMANALTTTEKVTECRVVVDLPDQLAIEVEQRLPNAHVIVCRIISR